MIYKENILYVTYVDIILEALSDFKIRSQITAVKINFNLKLYTKHKNNNRKSYIWTCHTNVCIKKVVCIKKQHSLNPWTPSSNTISVSKTKAVIKPALKYFDHFWSPRTLQILVAICTPAKVCGVSLSGMFSWAALSPVQSFLFVFLHENKWNRAVICRGEQSPLDWGGLRASSGFCSTLSWRFRETEGEHCSLALLRNDNRKKATEGIANAECQS